MGYLASLKNYFDTGKAKEKYGIEDTFDEFIKPDTTGSQSGRGLGGEEAATRHTDEGRRGAADAADDEIGLIAKPRVEQIHFIGKDIIYFHTLFWPAMLHFAKRKEPDNVYVHGFITVSGEKMSKSRGTGIDPLKYLKLGMNPEWLRYYIAAKLNANVEDVDFNPDDFVARVNSDLIGKYVNIASRCAGFIAKQFDGQLKEQAGGTALIGEIQAAANTIAMLFDEREYGKALREIMLFADKANVFVDSNKPWEIAKTGKSEDLHRICTDALQIFRLLTLYLKPVMPGLAAQVESFLNIAPLKWADAASLLRDGHRIKAYQHLMTRVDPKQLDALFDLPPSPPGRGAGGEGSKPPAKPKQGKQRHIPNELTDFARTLRESQTDAEALVWGLLRDRRVHDAEFRRQHPVEVEGRKFVLDFYCQEVKMAIELDGGQHQQEQNKDAARSNALKKAGIDIIRFWNNDVLSQTQVVLEAIWNELDKRMEKSTSNPPSPPAPLPEGEGRQAAQAGVSPSAPGGEGSNIISIDDFAKIDLRIAKIVKAEHVEGADKLLRLQLDVGELGTRQVFAGIKSAYDPAKLEGRLTVMVANLAPRKMKFGLSEGMVLAAGAGPSSASGSEPGLYILSPDSGAQPGMKVK